MERAALLRSGGATEKGFAGGGGSRRGGGAQQSAAVERHLAAAEANMALVQLGGLQTAEALADPAASQPQADAPPSEAPPASTPLFPRPPVRSAEAAWQRTVRQQWLLGRIAELRRQPAAAAAAFRACLRLLEGCSAEPAAGSVAPNEQPAPAGGPSGDSVSVSKDAAAEQQPLAAGPDSGAAAAAGSAAAAAGATPDRVRLRGCVVDAVISAEAVEAKLQV